jgi:hypothetical protein
MSATATNNSNFVGNEILYNALSSLLGILFKTTGSGNFLFGNNSNGTIIPAGTTTLPDVSYYLTATPLFWNITDSWPSIGISNNLNAGTIPAKKRFLAGVYTLMPEDVPANLNIVRETSFFDLYPNPASQQVTISFYAQGLTNVIVTVTDLQGKTLKRTIISSVYQGNNQKTMDVSDLSTGTYFVKTASSSGSCTRLLIVK